MTLPNGPLFNPDDWPDVHLDDEQFREFVEVVTEAWPATKDPMALRDAMAFWRSSGHTARGIMTIIDRLAQLRREEELGLVERVTLPDGTGVIYERDPFAELPTTEKVGE